MAKTKVHKIEPQKKMEGMAMPASMSMDKAAMGKMIQKACSGKKR